MIRRIYTFFTFLLRSKNQHGVHSPFVFKIVTQAFYRKKVVNPDWKNFLDYRKSVLDNKKNITSFSESKSPKFSVKRARILYNLCAVLQPQNVLEIGSSLGLASTCISLPNKNTKLTIVERNKHTNNITPETFQENNVKYSEVLVGDFNTIFPKSLSNISFDFVFINQNSSENILHIFNLLLNTVNNESTLIFTDIHKNKETMKMWQAIYNHPKVTVSIDTYKWGIVFFRKEQEKEHFVIRI